MVVVVVGQYALSGVKGLLWLLAMVLMEGEREALGSEHIRS